MTVQETVAIVGVLSAFLGALVALMGLRWSKQAVDAKDAQIAALRQQVDQWKDMSPGSVQTHVRALKELLEPQIEELRQNLNESNELLRRKSMEVTDEKRQIAALTGMGKLIFGIDDAELTVRRLTAWFMTEA